MTNSPFTAPARAQTMDDLIKELREEALIKAGSGLNNGCVDCSLLGVLADNAADALEAAQQRIKTLEEALQSCLRIIDEAVQESGRPIEYDEEDPFRMGEWFEKTDIAAIEAARAALKGEE